MRDRSRPFPAESSSPPQSPSDLTERRSAVPQEHHPPLTDPWSPPQRHSFRWSSSPVPPSARRTKELKNLPHVVTNGNLKSNFVNGIGVGIDAYTCKAQIDNADRGIKESYFKIAFKAFKNFKPFSIDVTIDGNSYHYDKVWFFVVQNGKYFGGGMKISPYSVRLDDKLEFYVIHNIGYRRLLAIFPLIFLGKHIWAKKYVKSVAGKNFSIKVNGYDVMQKDGEVEAGVNSLVVNRY